MARRTRELVPLRIMPKTIDAHCYNLVRLALHRMKKPIRIELEGLRGLEVIIEDDRWLCFDTINDDRPVLAWTDFQTSGRSALHEPVRCSLWLLDMHAGLIMGRALEALESALEVQLHKLRCMDSSSNG